MGNGIVAIDVDPRHGGDMSIIELQVKHGDLPHTATASTGGGGKHYFFKTIKKVKNSSGALAEGVDARSDGGFVVVAPSVHANGVAYTREAGLDEIVAAPGWLEMLAATNNRQTTGVTPDGTIPEGRRNEALYRDACAMRGRGMGLDPILAALRADKRCVPPLPDSELHQIAASACKRTPGKTSGATPEPPAGFYETPPPTDEPARSATRSDEPSAVPAGDGHDDDVDEENETRSDVGNARALAARCAWKFRYAVGMGWLKWDGRVWRRDAEDAAITREAIETVEDWAAGDDEGLASWGVRCQAAPRIKNMISLARALPEITVRVEELDRDEWLFTVANGTIDLKSGVLREHRPDDLITMSSDVTFDPEAKAPLFEKFLGEVQPAEEMRDFLRRDVGYLLTGSIREQKVLISYGSGQNGKSVFWKLVESLLGTYATTLSRATFSTVERTGGAASPDLVRLMGKRLATATELGVGQRIDEGLLKQLTGGERLAARDLHKSELEFQPKAKIVFSTNHLPNVGSDDGIRRRLLVAPFGVKIATDKRDNELPAKLAAELPGILNWAISGCLDWQKSGLGNAAAITAASNQLHDDADIFTRWKNASALIDRGKDSPFKTPRREIYSSFKAWCKEEGEEVMSARSFAAELRKLGVKDGGTMKIAGTPTPVDAWRGIKLRVTYTEPGEADLWDQRPS